MQYLDANVLLFAAVNQQPREHGRARALLDRLRSHTQEVFLTEPVLAEVAANLKTARLGRQSPERIATFLADIVALPSVAVADKPIWPRTLELVATYSIDLADAHQIALSERDGGGEIVSFDTDFDRIPGIKRIEP